MFFVEDLSNLTARSEIPPNTIGKAVFSTGLPTETPVRGPFVALSYIFSETFLPPLERNFISIKPQQ